jgi:hypothetical protein
MFVHVVAVVPPLLSDCPPELPQKAGLGDRFHYFRGRSGRRYLFSAVPIEALADFRNAVVMLGYRNGRGVVAHALATLDRDGRPASADRPWPPMARGSLLLVHLLAATEAERRAVAADLATAAVAPLRLAA